ncbi:MAG: alginate lyase family protein [Verrucomicrobiota bacterium]
MKWLFIIFLVCHAFDSACSYQDLTELVERQKPRIKKLFSALDLEKEHFEAVAKLVQEQDYEQACQALLNYYQGSKWVGRFSVEKDHPEKKIREADEVLEDYFTLQGLSAKVERMPHGGLDWWGYGPKNDIEWAVFLNRHYYFDSLYVAYEATGDAKYANKYSDLVTDWILNNPVPAKKTGSAQWRAMEAGRRITEYWPKVFYGMLQSNDVSDVAKILVLSSIPEHAYVCQNHHAKTGNHVLVEMLALAKCGIFWPEFKESRLWIEYAFAAVLDELEPQVYPDGAQKELSNHYQVTTLLSFERLSEMARWGEVELSEHYEKTLEKMWEYLVWITKPDGHGPLNNDADTEYNVKFGLHAAKNYNRQDWLYVLTHGKQGKLLDTEKIGSRYFPWAGHVVMRSDWSEGQLWAFFDIGPSGLAHNHYDKLHLSLSANGRNFLVDTGRYYYRWDKWRHYFLGTESHNTIRINGKKQRLGLRVREAPVHDAAQVGLNQGQVDFALGEVGFEHLEDVKHRRAVIRYADQYLIVVDEVIAWGGHELEAFWHFEPGAKLLINNDSVSTSDPKKSNLRISPNSSFVWDLKIVSGQEKPEIQGWWSHSYNKRVPCPTAVYQTKIRRPVRMAWLLEISKVGRVGTRELNVKANATELYLTVAGKEKEHFMIDLEKGALEIGGDDY